MNSEQCVDFNSAWILIKKVFPVLENYFSEELKSNETDLENVAKISSLLNLNSVIQDLIISKLEKYLRESTAPTFWSHFSKASNQYVGFQKFYKAITFLYNDYYKCGEVISLLNYVNEKNNFSAAVYGEPNLKSALKLIVRSVLLSQLPIEHKHIIEDFYDLSLKKFDSRDNSEVSMNCYICNEEFHECICQSYYDEVNRILCELELLEPMVGQILTSLIYTHIEEHIVKTCKDSFDISHVNSLEEWLDAVVIAWLKNIYCSYGSNDLSTSVGNFKQKLLNFLYEMYTKARINQLFNIIIEYPESLPALEDLRSCLPKTDLRPFLMEKLQKSMETRLLHPGVSTPDILTAYIASIRSMRVLDSSGLLLETVTQPVHQYLRSREDTIRCVVSSLTEEGTSDLADELVRGDLVQVDENTPSDEDGENWETWLPDPVDVNPNKPVNARRTSDIISMLVNVYGSKELFVNEYRTLLADRLLSQYSCDTEKEIRYLELLKLRFGDSQLHYCEVMLKDIADSKRINQHIKQDQNYEESDFPLSAMIVSAQFWPVFKDEKLELHSKLLTQMASYTKCFEALKGNRTLCWKNHLGVVNIEIQLTDRTLNLSVSPIHATILMHFQDKDQWSLEELSRCMHVPPIILRKKISFWQYHGLIDEIGPDIFYLTEQSDTKTRNPVPEIAEEYESESAMASAQDQREEELQTFWSYVIGMLMNLDSLPLDRIHQMLKMFAFQGPTIECSLQELRQFLDRKVREHKLVYSGGLYKLPKQDTL